MKTKLNAEMLVVVSPMGRDVAAFTHPEQAWHWVNSFTTGRECHYRRPDGETLGHPDVSGPKTLQAWAIAWEGNDA